MSNESFSLMTSRFMNSSLSKTVYCNKMIFNRPTITENLLEVIDDKILEPYF